MAFTVLRILVNNGPPDPPIRRPLESNAENPNVFTGPLTQATGPLQSDAGVGIGYLIFDESLGFPYLKINKFGGFTKFIFHAF